MNYKRAITILAVLAGALMAPQLLGRGDISMPVRLIYDIFTLALALAVFARIRPARTTGGELGRLLLGVPAYSISVALYVLVYEIALRFGRTEIGGSEGILLVSRMFLSFGLAWSLLSVIRLGGPYWSEHKRHVIIVAVVTLSLVLLNAPKFIAYIAGIYIALWVDPFRWVEKLKRGSRWWITLLFFVGPVCGLIFVSDITPGSGQEDATPGLTLIHQQIAGLGLLEILKHYFVAYWILVPVRIIMKMLRGAFGIRIPIWIKLGFNYIFSSLIPGLLLVALLAVAIYAGIGTLRSRTVRNLIYSDLQELEDALRQRRLDAYSEADSVAEGIYLRVKTDKPMTAPEPRSFSLDPGSPSTSIPGRVGYPGGVLESPLSTLPEGWVLEPLRRPGADLIPQLGAEESGDIWVKLAAKTTSWPMPDTLPLFPGWTDMTTGHHGLLPMGGGRTAFAAATARRAGSNMIHIALRPLNVNVLEGYGRVVNTDIVIWPNTELSSRIDADGSTESRLLGSDPSDPRWQALETIATKQDSADDLWHRSLYQGVCELQSWPQDQGGQRILGLIAVRTSLAGLFESLYPTSGLSRITLSVLLVLSTLLLAAVLFSSALGFGINRTITSSVKALRHGTEQLRKGNLEISIDVQNRDELGELAESFNHMTRDLRRMISQIAMKERLERELQIAREIQLKLLPGELPEIPGYSLAARSDPAEEVGGDYYDVLPRDHGKLLIALGDVSGKGVAAAMLMSNLQANLHVLASQNIPLIEVMKQLNVQIFRNSTPEMFITFFLAELDGDSGKVQFINAGHDTPVMISDGECQNLESGGLLLGVDPDANYQTGKVKLETGGLIVVYSDGLTEAMNETGVEFGRDRLIDELLNLKDMQVDAIVDDVMEKVRLYVGGEQTAEDDLTLMVVKKSDGS